MNQRKESSATEAAQFEALTLFDKIFIVLYSILIFLSMTITTRQMSVILITVALILTLAYALILGKRSTSALRQNLNIPAVGLLGYAVMNGLAAIYSSFDTYAVSEFNKFLASFAVTAILLFCFQKKYSNGTIWGLSVTSAAIGLLGVDAFCKGPIFSTFQDLMLFCGIDYSYVNEYIIPSRLNGIYNDSNVTASILALGCLFSLYLMINERSLLKRLLASLSLGLSAMSFFMSVSRGAMICFALALLLWLLVAGKGNRVRLLLLIIFSATVTAALSSVATSHFGGDSLLPDFLTLVCGPVVFLLDWLIGSRVSSFLQTHIKVSVAAMIVLTVGCAIFAGAAVTVSGSYLLAADHYLIRSTSLTPGEYSVSGDWDGDPVAEIYANTNQHSLLQKDNLVYNGALNDAFFIVPEGTTTVRLYISSSTDIELREVTFSDGTKLHLGYPLLPDAISDRLHDGLLSGANFLQRIQYDKDAVKLWLRSPMIGHGLGSTEGLYTSVQPYYYESLYAHNHILQVLCDMGLVGAIFFLTMMLGVAWLLIRHLIKERDLLASMLLACWVMINTHSLMEINFSVRGYQCFVYPLLMFMAMLYAPPIKEKAAKAVGIVGAAAIWLFMAVFGGLMASHLAVVREAAALSASDANVFMAKMNNFIRRDVFDNEQHKLNYVANALALNQPNFNGNMVKYAEDLRESGTYTACSGLARYYYLPQGDFENLFACSREGIAQEASTKEAWNLQLTFYRTEVIQAVTAENYEQFISGVLETKAYLDEYSKDRWEEIPLEEENKVFLSTVQLLRDNSVDAATGAAILLSMQ